MNTIKTAPCSGGLGVRQRFEGGRTYSPGATASGAVGVLLTTTIALRAPLGPCAVRLPVLDVPTYNEAVKLTRGALLALLVQGAAHNGRRGSKGAVQSPVQTLRTLPPKKNLILKFKKPTHLVGPGHLCIHFHVSSKGRPSRATSP